MKSSNKGGAFGGPDEWHQTPEYEVIVEAEKMLAVFLVKGAEEPQAKNWRSRYQEDCLKLVIKCDDNNIYPLPDSVVELCRQLRGKTKGGVEPTAKFIVLHRLAQEYDPPEEGEPLSEGVISHAAKFLEEAGGLRKTKVDPAGPPDYRQSVRPWLESEAFLKEWRVKRELFLKRQNDPNSKRLQEVVKETARQQ